MYKTAQLVHVIPIKITWRNIISRNVLLSSSWEILIRFALWGQISSGDVSVAGVGSQEEIMSQWDLALSRWGQLKVEPHSFMPHELKPFIRTHSSSSSPIQSTSSLRSLLMRSQRLEEREGKKTLERATFTAVPPDALLSNIYYSNIQPFP